MRPSRPLVALSLVASLALGLTVAPGATPVAGAAETVDWGDLSTDGLTLVGDSPDEQVLRLFLHPVSDVAHLEATALAVNDPSNPRYGEERTVAQAGGLAVPEHRVASIRSTLEAAGADEVKVHETRAFVVGELTVAEAESLFGVTWQRWTAEGVDFDVPASTPVLPEGLDGHVDAVYGAMTMVQPSPPAGLKPVLPAGGPVVSQPAAATDGGTPTRTGTPDPSACAGALDAGGFLPDQLADAYGLSALHDAGYTGAGIRIAVVDGSLYQHSDLATYRACLAPDATPITDHVIGSPGIDIGTVEAALDLEVVSSMAPGVARLDEFMVSNPETPFVAGGFLDLVAAPFHSAATGGEDPHVVSLSYGYCEALYLDEDPMAGPALTMSEQVLATAAAARISYFVSSGDSGSTGCAHNGGSTTDIVPSYPATSPWVTAVGGTNLTLADDNSIVSSGVWNDNSYPAPFTHAGGGGGGGVSTLLARPSWQDPLVPSAAGRSVPDVALYADSLPGWTIYADVPSAAPQFDGWATVGGTSASTPLTASLTVLVDQVNLERGQPTLGWLNPLLYSLAATDGGADGPFLDITLGTNAVLDGISVYSATTGYDLASGLGSVLADRLAAALADPVAASGSSGIDVDRVGTAQVALTARPDLPGGEVLSYSWDFDDDGSVDAVTGEPRVVHAYEAEGAYRARVVVRTSLGRTATFTTMFSTAHGTDGLGPAFTG